MPKNYYSLRSQAKQGQILDANFALKKKNNNKYYYKSQLCRDVEKIKMPNINEKEPKKSILVKKKNDLNNIELWGDWSNNLSSDQVLG